LNTPEVTLRRGATNSANAIATALEQGAREYKNEHGVGDRRCHTVVQQIIVMPSRRASPPPSDTPFDIDLLIAKEQEECLRTFVRSNASKDNVLNDESDDKIVE